MADLGEKSFDGGVIVKHLRGFPCVEVFEEIRLKEMIISLEQLNQQ